MPKSALYAVVVALVVACSSGGSGAPFEPTPAVLPAVLPTASPQPSPTADVCHVNGVTYCALNPAVTQATIGTTICVRGWTARVRPPVSYTDTLKQQQLQQFASQHQGDLEWNVAGTEEDHRLSLDLGGAPMDPMNLSPEVHRSSTLKDQDEAALGGSQGKVCRGLMTLQEAQQELISTWLAEWPGYRK